MEKSDCALDGGEGAEGDVEVGVSFTGEASDWPEFRIIDRRSGLRD